jgi:hypothetical protein
MDGRSDHTGFELRLQVTAGTNCAATYRACIARLPGFELPGALAFRSYFQGRAVGTALRQSGSGASTPSCGWAPDAADKAVIMGPA